MIIFGGCADLECDIPLNDTWVLTNANGLGGTPVWTELSPGGTLSTPRAFHNAMYDAVKLDDHLRRHIVRGRVRQSVGAQPCQRALTVGLPVIGFTLNRH